jgi:hypothetical protein
VDAEGHETNMGSQVADTMTTLLGRRVRLIVRRQPRQPRQPGSVNVEIKVADSSVTSTTAPLSL